MTLPSIAATGVMSSGDYVTYMISYLDNATTVLSKEMENYASDQNITDWYTKWAEIINDANSDMTILNDDISMIQSQLRMMQDAISRL